MITSTEEIAKITKSKVDQLLMDDVWQLQKNRIKYLVDKNSKFIEILEH